jgi:hypothetical protein
MLLLPSSNPNCESWNSIGVRLLSAIEYRVWREAPWLRDVLTSNDAPGRVQAYRLTETQYVQQLDSAVEHWLAGDALPTLEHPASYLLALRFSTVGFLLCSFEGFFPAPATQNVAGIYSQFLLPWWQKNGADYAVGYSCSGYDIYDPLNTD